ncbi:hypothetical protein AGMMS49525_08370 [Bacteroidia bacterium]|nr:hypothetical protein AGMMS49525_08370 [Bacteroidia bacterium]
MKVLLKMSQINGAFIDLGDIDGLIHITVSTMKKQKYSLNFGKKEKVLNYATQPNPVRDYSSVETETILIHPACRRYANAHI